MEERARTSRPFELRVASTWDGRPIPLAEQARLRLRLTQRELLIAIAAPFHGDPPPPGPPGPTPGLWEHEVIELFVVGAGPAGAAPRYTEVELSPSGHHLVLRLEGVRNVIADRLPLTLRTYRRAGRWLAAARLDLSLLPSPPWRANAFAIHGPAHSRRFLAATPLPGARPNFHQPERFAPLTLGATG